MGYETIRGVTGTYFVGKSSFLLYKIEITYVPAAKGWLFFKADKNCVSRFHVVTMIKTKGYLQGFFFDDFSAITSKYLPKF